MSHKSGQNLIDEAKARVSEVSAADAMKGVDSNVTYLDVREPQEWNLGRIPNAVFIPRGTLEGKVEGLIPRDKKVVVYCAGGNRSALAADTMQQMGYASVSSMVGGFKAWTDAGGDVES